MNKYLAFLLLFVTTFTSLFAQEPDTSLMVQKSDTIYRFGDELTVTEMEVPTDVAEEELSKDPVRAIMLAAVLPGLGQAYNGKYFKIPIVYLALGGAGYAVSFNTSNYKKAVEAYSLDPSTTNENYLSYWRRNMELSYIVTVALYGLQILDAYVDALLFTWDVNDQLSLRVSPSLQPMMMPGQAPIASYGLTCGFNIRGR